LIQGWYISAMRFRLLLLLAAGLLTGCATLPPGERDPRDRFERFNRAIFTFNDALDRAIGEPLATGYVKVTPAPVRAGIGNFFNNLTYPTVIVNDLLQLKLKAFASDTGRLLLNTTIGIGGLFDPATQVGLPAGDEDFGQTLGRWGVPAGPYVMWPIAGPSTLRDTITWYPDQLTDPKTYASPLGLRLGLNATSLLLDRVELLPADDPVRQSFDPYVFVRNAYLKRREYLVKDGKVPTEELEIFEDEADPAAEKPAADPAQ